MTKVVASLILIFYLFGCTTSSFPTATWTSDRPPAEALREVSLGSVVTLVTRDGEEIHGRVLELQPGALNVEGRWTEVETIAELTVFDDSFSRNDALVLGVTVVVVVGMIAGVWLYTQADGKFGL